MIRVQIKLEVLLALVATALLLAACGGDAQQPTTQGGAAGAVGTVVQTNAGQYRDITPAELVTAVFTEAGVLEPPYEESIARVVAG